MSDTRTTKVLFREWRGGDAEAGGIMAQRFADWYYAISTSRLGESRGQGPCENACKTFGDGIVRVTEDRELIPWAHSVILAELETAGSRATDGDEPNAYTGNQKPKMLLAKARQALATEVGLLEAVYGGTATPEEIDQRAQPLGGNPLGVLKARYAVKRWLRDNAGVPFDVAPEQPILDRAPLPLYESDSLASKEEEASFEHWMISDIDLCKDIAEFAHFSIALRGGLPSDAEVAAADARAAAAAPSATGGSEAVDSAGSGAGKAIAGVAVLVILGGLVLAGAAAAFFFLM